MSICILSLIDDDITVYEKIDDNIYEYLIKMVSEYKNNELVMYLVYVENEKATYIKLYSSIS